MVLSIICMIESFTSRMNDERERPIRDVTAMIRQEMMQGKETGRQKRYKGQIRGRVEA